MSAINVINDFFNRRILHPAMNLLKQGMTPHKLATTIAIGTMVGVVPALGVTTIMSTMLAARFRLNIAATVLITYLVQPLQLLLIIPFIKMGIVMFGLQDLKLSLSEITALFKQDWLSALDMLWKANLAAVSAWVLVAIPTGLILYLLILPLLKRFLPNPVIESAPAPLV